MRQPDDPGIDETPASRDIRPLIAIAIVAWAVVAVVAVWGVA